VAGKLTSGLARKLFTDTADIDCKLALRDTPPASFWELTALGELPGWEGLEQLLTRIITKKIPTLVYGDYDVDGVSASFMMYRFLKRCGVPGNCFLPSRFRHGYGLSEQIVGQAAGQGYGALLALDCGTTNLAAVELAVNAGIDVAIIDHHAPKDELPRAPLVNPTLSADSPPLCTAGLVYAVLEQVGSEYDGIVGDELEIAGMATIGDVVPLEPANWYLASEALRLLPTTTNYGLQALVKVAGHHGLTRLTAQQVAFGMVPRLNAPGRMSSARKGLDLLFADDAAAAGALAAEIDRLNWDRRSTADDIARQAILDGAAFDAAAALALYRADWHPGVLGLVAARVAEQYGKPAVVLADAPGETELLAGSVRSDGVSDVLSALTQCPALASFGGHAMAAGVKLLREDLEQFREQWSGAVAAGDSAGDSPKKQLLEVGLEEFTAEFEADMWRLAPFGADFPAPRLLLRPCMITRLNLMGRDKTHVSLVVSDGERELRIVGFRQSHLASRHRAGDLVQPEVEIDVDNYNNQCTIQVRLLSLAEHHGPRNSDSR
jgi:single-stranded-DNA-specific exonuclease